MKRACATWSVSETPTTRQGSTTRRGSLTRASAELRTEKSKRSNGDTPGATEAKALTNGANRHPKTEVQDATAAGG